MFIVIELQTNESGHVANLITQHETIEQAESKYYQVLSYAAVSEVPVHAVMLCYSNGNFITSKCYTHSTEE